MNASSIIRKLNQTVVKKSQAPYNVPFDPQNIPHVVDATPGRVIVFDGWQNLPAQDLDPDEALKRAFTRAITIQRAQIQNRVTFHHERLNTIMIVDSVKDPFKIKAEQDRQARLSTRKSMEKHWSNTVQAPPSDDNAEE